MHVPRKTLVLITTSFALLLATSAIGQEVTCIQPRNCSSEVTSDTTTQFLTVQVTNRGLEPVRNATVTFELVKGAGSFTGSSTTQTDANGFATAAWVPAHGSPYPAEFRVKAVAETGNGAQTILLSFKRVSETIPLFPSARSGTHQAWYEDRQLRRRLRVVIQGPDSEAACQRTAVAFRPIGGGSTAPDTSYGQWHSNTVERCVAETRWRLPKGVGLQTLRATTGSDQSKGITFLAHARGLPRILVGLVGYRTHSLAELDTVSADTIEVTRKLPDQITSITFDSVSAVTKVDTTDRVEALAPTIGVDFPVLPSVGWLRVSLATTMKNPEDNVFMGVSLPQLWRGVQQEAVGFDFHLVGHLQRQGTLGDPTACAADSSQCHTRKRWRFGFGIMGTTDAGSIIGNVATIFGIK